MREDMSDFEVNQQIARLLGYKVERKHLPLLDFWAMWKYGGSWLPLKDYCNSWADIGPLIDEHWDYLNEEDQFGVSRWDQVKCSLGVKATRAAAICILKKLESGK